MCHPGARLFFARIRPPTPALPPVSTPPSSSLQAPGRGRFARWLETAPSAAFVLIAVTAAFTTYFSMYAFRKPFAAAKFDGLYFMGTGIGLKTALVIGQIIGYALSKWVGIKFCSEITPGRRARTLVTLVLVAEFALLLFAVVPDPLKVVALFFNGIPLGMIWGLVVWYLEGRRTSEILMAGLACSFIVASGVTKDFARALMAGTIADLWSHLPLLGPLIGNALGKVSEFWMPFITGLHFLPFFLLGVWTLQQLPKPNASDVATRAPRTPMNGSDRLAFLRRFGLGMLLLCTAYFFLTAYRDFRDNYQVEIFEELGYRYDDNKVIISQAETLVTAGVIAAMALLNAIHGNRKALLTAFIIMTGGLLMLGGATALFSAGWVNGFWWMTLTGLGSYLAYVPFNAMLFERLMAATRATGTAVFAIYVADSVGYTGSVGIQLFKDLAQKSSTRLGFFQSYTWFLCIVGSLCLIAAAVYFLRRSQTTPEPTAEPGPAPTT